MPHAKKRTTAAKERFSPPKFALAFLISTQVVAFTPALSAAPLPTGGQVSAGSASISQAGTQMAVDVATDRAVIDWSTFSIGAGHGVNFSQPAVTSAVLNRVLSGDPSAIHGNLTANGAVYLVNPNGVVVGPGGTVDAAGGFVASTLEARPADFMAGGDLVFRGGSTAAVVNLGAINAVDGDVFMIAQRVENAGSIRSGGHVGLAAGNEVLLAASGAGPERILVAPSGLDAEGTGIDNSGLVEAVSAELRAAGNLYALAINSSGEVRATGVAEEGGRVLLVNNGGVTEISGELAAQDSDGTGGTVDVLGEHLALRGGASIDASGDLGGGIVHFGGSRSGEGPLPNSSTILIEADASITADALLQGDGGTVIAFADDTARIHGDLSASALTAGHGGFVETSGKRFLDVTAAPRATGADYGSGGEWLIDPDTVILYTGTIHSGLDGVSTPTNIVSLGDITLISIPLVEDTLNLGMSVTITATADATGNSIEFIGDSASIDKTAGGAATLALSALTGTVTVNGGINADPDGDGTFEGTGEGSAPVGALTVDIDATNVVISGTIDTNAGDLEVDLDAAGTILVTDDADVDLGGGTATFTGFGGGADTVTIESSTLDATLATFGGGDGDELIGPDTGATFDINAGTVDLGTGTLMIAGAEPDTVTGGSGDDTFIAGGQTIDINGGQGDDDITLTAAITGTADGQLGNDSLDVSAFLGTVDITGNGSSDGLDGDDNGTTLFANINALTADGTGTLDGPDVNAVWDLDGTSLSTTSRTMDFTDGSFTTLQGGSEVDRFNVIANVAYVILGGPGADVLTISSSRTLTGTFDGEDGFDTIVVETAGVMADATVAGASGFDGDITGIAPGGPGFFDVDAISATAGNAMLTGPAAGGVWAFDGAPDVTSGGQNLAFNGFNNIDAGAGVDIFGITSNTTASIDGGAGADRFNIADGANVSGALTGGADGDIDLLDFSAYTTDLLVTVTGAATAGDGAAGVMAQISGGFDGIADFEAGAGTDTLTGPVPLAPPVMWSIDVGDDSLTDGGFPHFIGFDAGFFNFVGFETLQGNTGSDVFLTVAANGDGPLTVNGGAGADTLTIGGFVLDGTFDGQAGIDQLDVSTPAGADDVTLTTTGGTDGFNGTVASEVSGGFFNINDLVGDSARGIVGTASASNWTIDAVGNPAPVALVHSPGPDAGAGSVTDVATNQSTFFDGFFTATGGAAVDTFTVSAMDAIDLDGAGSDDSFILNMDLFGSATLANTIVGGADGFVAPGNGGDTITDNTPGGGFILDGPDTASGAAALPGGFSGVENWNGSEVSAFEPFTVANAAGSLRGVLDGRGSLAGTPGDFIDFAAGGSVAATTVTITGDGSGTTTEIGAFADIEQIISTLDPAGDTFDIDASATMSLINLAGANTYNLADGVVLTGHPVGLAGPVAITGAADPAEVINLSDDGNLITTGIAGPNSGNATSLVGGAPGVPGFFGVPNITGGTGADTLVVSAPGGGLTGTFDGGGGSDTLVESPGDEAGGFTSGGVGVFPGGILIGTASGGGTGNDLGQTANVADFVSVENVSGGGGDDRIILDGGQLTGTLNGGGNTAGIGDVVILDNAGGANTVNLTGSGTINGMPFASVEAIQGDDADDDFNILANVVIDLLGGDGNDTFDFSDGARITSSGSFIGGGFAINGQGLAGVDRDELDFGLYTTPVNVTLTGVDPDGYDGTTTPTGVVLGGFDGIDDIIASSAGGTFTATGDTFWTLDGAGQMIENGHAGILNPTDATMIAPDTPTTSMTILGFTTLQGDPGGAVDVFLVDEGSAAANADILNGGPGADTLAVDTTSNDAIDGTVTFNGEAGADLIIIGGGTEAAVTYTFDSEGDGSIALTAGTGTRTIDYSNITPIIDASASTTRTFDYLDPADEVITVNSTAGGSTGTTDEFIDSDVGGESVEFATPTNLVITTSNGDGADTVSVAGTGIANAITNITINGGSDDAVDLTIADGFNAGSGNLVVNGAATSVDDSQTTVTSMTFNGPVTIDGSATLTSPLITFNSTLDGPLDLTLAGGGTYTFNGAVGSLDPLDTLTADATTVINGGSVTTDTGGQTYADVDLGADTTLTGTAGDLVIDGTVTGNDFDLVADFLGTYEVDTVVNLGAGNLTLNFDGGVTDVGAGAITAAGLELLGTGDFILDDGTHNVDTIAGDVDGGDIHYVEADDLDVGVVNASQGLIVDAGEEIFLDVTGDLGLLRGVEAPDGVIELSVGGSLTQVDIQKVTEGIDAPVITGSLLLVGTGPFILPSAQNDVDTLAAGDGAGGRTGDAILFKDRDELVIGTVTSALGAGDSAAGIMTSDDDVSLQVGGALLADSLTIGDGGGQDIDLGTGDLTVTVDAADVGGGFSAIVEAADSIIIATNATFNLEEGDADLDELNTIEGVIDFNTPLGNTTGQTLDLQNTPVGGTTTLAALNTQFLFLEITGDVVSTAQLNVSGAPTDNAGHLEFAVTGGSLSFTNLENDFIDVTGLATVGSITLADQNAFNITDTALDALTGGGLTTDLGFDVSLTGFGGVTGNPPNPQVGTVDLFTDSGAAPIVVGGDLIIDGLDVNFDGGGLDVTGEIILTVRNAVLNDTGAGGVIFGGAVATGASSVTDTLDLTAVGPVTQTAPLIGGTPMRFTLIDAPGTDVTLTLAGNQFGIISINADNAILAQDGTLTLESALITTDLTVTSNLGNIVDRETNRTHQDPSAPAPPILPATGTAAGAITVGDDATFTTSAAGADIRLVDEANTFTTDLVLRTTGPGGDALITSNSDIVFGVNDAAQGTVIGGNLTIQEPILPAQPRGTLVDMVTVSDDGATAITVTGTVNIVTSGDVEFGRAPHAVGAWRVDVSEKDSDITGDVTFNSRGNDISIREAGDVVLELIKTSFEPVPPIGVITGDLLVTSDAGDITDGTVFPNPIRVSGTSTFTTTGGDVILDGAKNVFGGSVGTFTSTDVTITAISSVDLAAQLVGGDLVVSADAGITQTGPQTVIGTATFTAEGADAEILLPGMNDFMMTVRINSGTGSLVTLADINAIELGTTEIGGDLVVSAPLGITQEPDGANLSDPDIVVHGTSVFSTTTGDIVLGDQPTHNNQFGQVRFITTDADVFFTENGNINIGGSTDLDGAGTLIGPGTGGTDVMGDLNLTTTEGSIIGAADFADNPNTAVDETTDNEILVSGDTNLSVDSQVLGRQVGVNLPNPDNAFTGTITITNGTTNGTFATSDGVHAITNSVATDLGTIDVDGQIRIRSDGAVTQSGVGVQTLSTLTITSLTGVPIDVTLEDAANSFGPIRLGERLAEDGVERPIGDVSIVETGLPGNGIVFEVVNIAGDLTAVANQGNITDNKAVSVAGQASFQTTRANDDIVFDNPLNQFNIVAFNTTGADADVTINSVTPIIINDKTAAQFGAALFENRVGDDLNITAQAINQITDIDTGIDGDGVTTLETVEDIDLPLTVAAGALDGGLGNTFGELRLRGDDAEIGEADAILLGNSALRGNLILTSTGGGDITDVAGTGVNVQGDTTLTSGGDIILNSGTSRHNGLVTATATGGDIELRSAGSLQVSVGATTTLVLHGAEGVTQTTPIVTGTATISSVTGDIVLLQPANDFITSLNVASTNANALIDDMNTVSLGTVNVRENFDLEGSGDITDTGNTRVDGVFTIRTTTDSSVTITAGTNLIGSVNVFAGDFTLTEADSTALGNIDLTAGSGTGSLSVTTTSGNVTQVPGTNLQIAALTLDSANLADLQNPNNEIATLLAVTTNGSFEVSDSEGGLTVVGPINAAQGVVRQPVIIASQGGGVLDTTGATIPLASNVFLVTSGTLDNTGNAALFDDITGNFTLYAVSQGAATVTGGLVFDYTQFSTVFPTASGIVGDGLIFSDPAP